MAEVEDKHAPLGWCLDGHHKKCPGHVKSGAGRVVCTCRHHQEKK